jgi:WbqC-like protein family
MVTSVRRVRGEQGQRFVTLAIMQPTFLPWAGYFNLMARCDHFVLLDDAQFEKQSWQSRNRILVQGVAHTVIASTLKAPLETPINAIRVAPRRLWLDGLLRTIMQSYATSAERDEIIALIEESHAAAQDLLAEMNIGFILRVSERLGIPPAVHRASALNVEGKRSRRLEAMCHRLGETRYLSPVGSSEYLKEDGFGAGLGLELVFQDYRPLPYPQRKVKEFVSHLSIVDVVCQIGWERAAAYVRTGTPLLDERGTSG